MNHVINHFVGFLMIIRHILQLLDDNKDFYVSQDTWNGYESMLRYLKKYDLKFSYHKNHIKGMHPLNVETEIYNFYQT